MDHRQNRRLFAKISPPRRKQSGKGYSISFNIFKLAWHMLYKMDMKIKYFGSLVASTDCLLHQGILLVLSFAFGI